MRFVILLTFSILITGFTASADWEVPSIAVIGNRLLDIRVDRTLGVQLTWDTDQLGVHANTNSSIGLRTRYTLILQNTLTGQLFSTESQFDDAAPTALTFAHEIEIPTNSLNEGISDGTYRVTLSALYYKFAGKAEIFLGRSTITDRIFVITRDHIAFTIADPILETRAMAPVQTGYQDAFPDRTPPRVGVIIPPYAVTEPTLIWIDRYPGAFTFSADQVGPAFSFAPEIDFARPVTIVIPYDQAYESAIGGREFQNQAATLYQGVMLPVDSSPDIFSNEVFVTTTHFSVWWVNLFTNVAAAFLSWMQSEVTHYDQIYDLIVSQYTKNVQKYNIDGTLGSTFNVLANRFQYSCGDRNPQVCFDYTTKHQDPECGQSPPNQEAPHHVGAWVEALSYVELLNRYGDGAFDLNGLLIAQPNLTSARKERMKSLVKYGIYLIASEAANLGYNRTDRHSPWLDHGLRGWGDKNDFISCSLYSGFQSFGNHTGTSLLGLAQVTMAIRQYVLDGYDGNVFDSEEDADNFVKGPVDNNLPGGHVLLSPKMVFRDDPSSASLSANPCPNEGDNTATCFETWRHIENLTYAGAYSLFKGYTDEVMHWWRGCPIPS